MPGHGVSVVVPVHNRPEGAAQAVRSALAQSLPPLEVIVVDDASDEPLTEERLGVADPRLRIVRLGVNSGASAARQAGVALARGEIVAFLDSDDVWLPGKLAAQLPLLGDAVASRRLLAVAGGWERQSEHGEPGQRLVPVESADPLAFASGCWFSPGSTVVLPRFAFEIVGPFDPRLRRLEDSDWFLRFALLGGRLVVAREMVAVVSAGRRSRVGTTKAAGAIILAKAAAACPRALRSKVLRRLRAYVDLEIASAARNEGRPLAMCLALARSFARRPRFRLQLERWWSVERAPDGIPAAFAAPPPRAVRPGRPARPRRES
ncbi:glycosyltransferase family 2 protein [Propylenella binzhouense]|uniref:Glycosyltransferase family 2 protein n=1 Tax=Propylenella binzhouense TaxID=2555902 RepID=A0A964WT79_9HYPH|nr:glycosyltransferase family A protein [Propylenella binzhouense]MYZ47752.1 glycosyltransferase family 2 protein [Propylenella binzhouense]